MKPLEFLDLTLHQISQNEKAINLALPAYEFHIAKDVRKKYELEDELFSITGNVVFANFHLVRQFTQKINSKRDTTSHVKPGEINAAGLIDEIYHFVLSTYEKDLNPGVMKRAVNHLNSGLGEETVYKILYEFVTLFPPMEVYKERSTITDYLSSFTGNKSNLEIVTEELILLYFANFNKANKNIIELFDENYFENKETYTKIISSLYDFFSKETKIGPDNYDVFTFLKTPILHNAEDIEAQLDFIFEKWKIIIKDEFKKRILTGKDLIKEDIHLAMFGGGGAPTVVPKYKGDIENADMLALGKSGYKFGLNIRDDYDEPERFTSDIDWMPRVVMLAKNAHVWLDQLSKQYQRHIHRLDQIPDEELDKLERWNFTGLWLIGLWERSSASKRIKHIMGNIDAVGSAYSLFDYEIAHELGGEEAYNNLNERAKARGIRLASDMVPNHTGIYSRWVIEHPEYFIQLDYSPFPNYKFTGENLSEDPNFQIRIEDGYYSHSDASVVFQRIDNRTGEARYLYHGNDGTNMPWNDTAQLDMIKPEVREAVIQKIFDVARKFSIIRFDAAMTLAKKHFSRLWYPQPGTGGDIPTRSDFALTRDEFDARFQVEFWREVVDRINSEMPNTLLLAEAFWLMEGYFVRTLGMHRVYNSAFMHMMMKEENEKYRDLITNTLEFEPEILKRYVNFMSNPDEETAIKQFGTNDKYFGVAVMMVTLPGLPMFGHGQVEGYTEKYGMEYKRAYYDETPNGWLVERHEKEIFPLMRRRYLFSQVRNFWFYDFIDDAGNLNENVFAFTNTERGERAVIIYNNKYERTAGRIKISTPKLVDIGHVDKQAQTCTLAEALNIRGDHKIFYTYRDHTSGLEYLVRASEIHNEGFRFELDGFKYKILLDFNEVYDKYGDYEKLFNTINGEGLPSIQKAVSQMKMEPFQKRFENIIDNCNIDELQNEFIKNASKKKSGTAIKFFTDSLHEFYEFVNPHYNGKLNCDKMIVSAVLWLESVKKLNKKKISELTSAKGKKATELLRTLTVWKKNNYEEGFMVLLIWIIIDQLRRNLDSESVSIIDKFQLYPVIDKILYSNIQEGDIADTAILVKLLGKYNSELFDLRKNKRGLFRKDDCESITKYLVKYKSQVLMVWLKDKDVLSYLGANTYNNVLYYNKERFEKLLNWLNTITILAYLRDETDLSATNLIEKNIIISDCVKLLSAKSGYQLEILRAEFEHDAKKVGKANRRKGKRK